MTVTQYPPAESILTTLTWVKTAGSAITSLSGNDDTGQTLAYTPGQEQVYLNGVLLTRGTDYVATTGNTITGLSGITSGDNIKVYAASNYSLAAFPAASITGSIANTQLANNAITVNGVSIPLGGSVTAGAINSIVAGNGLTGGGTTGVVTIALNPSSVIPAQSGKGGYYLTTDGVNLYWTNSNVIPGQAGNGGKFLQTDGTNLTWQIASVPGNTFYIGTTLVANNRSSASQTLTGISIDGNAATVTNGLTTSNYNSYALPLGGGTLSGLVVGSAQPATGVTILTANDTGNFSVRSTPNVSTSPATMSFHRPGIYAVNVGLDTDNYFKIGGWSAGILMSISSTGATTIGGALTQNSDISLKENLIPITNALDKVKKLQGYNYNRIGLKEIEMGVIAQEVQKILPEVVSKSSEGILSVAYSNMVAILIEAIKEQSNKISDLEEQIKKIKENKGI